MDDFLEKKQIYTSKFDRDIRKILRGSFILRHPLRQSLRILNPLFIVSNFFFGYILLFILSCSCLLFS